MRLADLIPLTESEASDEAHKRKFTYAGYGKWKDKDGNTVAKTVNDKLVPINSTGPIGPHLKSRGIDLKKTKVILDKKSNLATFLLYNLSGQLVGYQRYNPAGSKDGHNDPKFGKYYSYITKEGPKTAKLAVWGLETVTENTRVVFITEGIFDAVKIHNAGFAAVAVLTNNPLILKSWLVALNKTIVVIADDDSAGVSLQKMGTHAFTTPKPYKDLGEMPQEEATAFIKSIVNKL